MTQNGVDSRPLSAVLDRFWTPFGQEFRPLRGAKSGLGWCGLPMTLSHLIEPHHATLVIAIIGFALWFATGWATAIVFVWGG